MADRREKGGFSATTHDEVARRVVASGERVTEVGEQHVREHGKLNPLVDPKSHGGIREALNLLIPNDKGEFVLRDGIAIPDETDVDGTGSMSHNVRYSFESLPKTMNLLVTGANPIMGRYHYQAAHGLIQDVEDRYPAYQITEFEPDNAITDQLRMLAVAGAGGDAIEDYQLGLFYMARRVKTSIGKYGLKGYYTIVGDERGRRSVTGDQVVRFLGGTDQIQTISVEELGKEVLAKWHAFFLQIGGSQTTTDYWSKVYSRDRVVILPQGSNSYADYLAETKAAIIGLTEGVIDLQSLPDWLTDVARLNKEAATKIVQAVAHIPLGAQAALSGFNKIPPKGSIFENRDDTWPIGWSESSSTATVTAEPTKEDEAGGVGWL